MRAGDIEVLPQGCSHCFKKVPTWHDSFEHPMWARAQLCFPPLGLVWFPLIKCNNSAFAVDCYSLGLYSITYPLGSPSSPVRLDPWLSRASIQSVIVDWKRCGGGHSYTGGVSSFQKNQWIAWGTKLSVDIGQSGDPYPGSWSFTWTNSWLSNMAQIAAVAPLCYLPFQQSVSWRAGQKGLHGRFIILRHIGWWIDMQGIGL